MTTTLAVFAVAVDAGVLSWRSAGMRSSTPSTGSATPMSRATFNRVTYAVVEQAQKEGLAPAMAESELVRRIAELQWEPAYA